MGAMLRRTLASALLFLCLLVSIAASENDFSKCDCDDQDSFWSVESIMECQKVSDFLIAVAYFSIPIELLYFVSCSNVPFKWVLFQFIAFIVLCGMTHLLNGWTYGVHTFQLMLALTIFKFLTALVSFATAITLITLIPLLLKVKVRELMLKKKTWDLGREVGIIKKQKEAGWHVRMLTQEIRKSLDRHTILYTTLDKLSETLDLQNCAVWMPDEARTEMNLTHELKGSNSSRMYNSIPITDPFVRKIKENEGVHILDPNSALATASSGQAGGTGPVAAIRMPMLRVSDFRGGTPEMIKACYAILVLVLPGEQGRYWSEEELEIVMVVADQVAVAISHAAVLEESQLMREKLVEQNRALQQAKQDALMASQARNSFQMVMSNGLRRPMHSVMGLLSMIQDEKLTLTSQQRVLADTMVKTSSVLSVLINDVMDTSLKDNSRFPLEIRSFQLRSTIQEAACVAKCLCINRGYGFALEVERSLPDFVMGDERRVFQVILHMVGHLLKGNNERGCLTFRIFSESGSQGRTNDQRWAAWRSNSSDGYVSVKFEIGVNKSGGSSSMDNSVNQRYFSGGIEEGLSFSVCKNIVQLMQGNIWVTDNQFGFDKSMSLILWFQLRPSIVIGISDPGGESLSDNPNSNSLFKGLQVLLADEDDVNRAVTRRLLEKLGCIVTSVSSGYECLSAVSPSLSSFQIIILDLHMADLDGFEITSRIQKFRSRSWPLIIAMTSSDSEDLWGKCSQVGMNGVIQKPVLLKGIADELRRVLVQTHKSL
jgi:ethylene receptor